MINALQFFDGPCKTWLGDPAPWQPWRVFLKALTATPLTEDERTLFQNCTGRTAEFPKPVQEAWVVVGRRGRKSAMAAILAVHSAVFQDWSGCLAPGEIGRVFIVAVDRSQARIIRNYCEAILQSHPDLEALIDGADKNGIQLKNDIEIVVVSNNFRSIRGRAIVCAICEELAFWRDESSAVPDKEVLRAITPSMLTTKKAGALLIGISSPYAKKGLLYSKWKEHFGQDESNVLVWQASTETMSPTVDKAEIEKAYLDDPASAAAEFGAMFRDDISNFLDPELLATLTRPKPLEIQPQKGIKYRSFMDPSGGRGDSFAIGISHRDNETGRVILDLVRAKKAPFDPAVVVKEFAALLKSYHLTECTGDNYSAQWCLEAFKAEGITYKLCKIPKSSLYIESLPMFTKGLAELPDYRPLLVELGSLERRTARSGKDSVDHPLKGHDDLANSACGALYLAGQGKSSGKSVPPAGAIALSNHDIPHSIQTPMETSFGFGGGGGETSTPWLSQE